MNTGTPNRTAQPKQVLDPKYPHVHFYVFEDGHTSMAVHSCWVSALFESLDAAKSWVGFDLDADKAFAKLNAATGGKGELFLGSRQ